jgi:asparagine synthase (glutamine-hydrolysing)
MDAKKIRKHFMKGQGRGPENSVLKYDNNNAYGFHRLAINGYKNPLSEQPINLKNCMLICNGEIYNYKHLHEKIGIKCETFSDCEIIIHLYREFGIEYTLQLLDGVFAFVLVDFQSGETFVARDTYGVRPLYISGNNWMDILPFSINDYNMFGFASEIKQLVGCYEELKEGAKYKIKQFKPGHYVKIKDRRISEYINFSKSNSFINNTLSESDSRKLIKKSLFRAVEKRVCNTDRDIACLLSGGLDSSLITALVVYISMNKFKKHPSQIHTWSIGMKGSEDLKYAKMVANHLKTTHHQIELDESEFLEAIEEVIYAIESYDTTTVRASVGNWLISKYIKNNSNAKVIFNGDGSDEVTGGYIYFNNAPNEYAFDKECRKLLNDIHYFDVLRSDRSISSHGLEPRTPFLDRNFVQTYLSIPPNIRSQKQQDRCEKYLLRETFEDMNILPLQVLWRTKEAFSDGVSKSTKSWFEVIQDFASEKLNISNKKNAENTYYKQIYFKYFGNNETIPYKWMPNFVEATDASARTLECYNTSFCPKCMGNGLIKTLDSKIYIECNLCIGTGEK